MATVVAGAALGAGTAAAATSTTVVTQADIAQSCATTTSGFCTDLSGTAGSANVQGTPTGSGYLDLKTPLSTDKVQVFNTSFVGKPLSSITGLSYDSLVTNPSTADQRQAPSVQIVINPNKAGVGYATLVWEPVYTDTPSVPGEQEHFHPTASPSGQGGWWTIKNAAALGQQGALGFNQYTSSFTDVLAAIPNSPSSGESASTRGAAIPASSRTSITSRSTATTGTSRSIGRSRRR